MFKHAALLLVTCAAAQAFSLNGPFETWMQPAVGFMRDPARDVAGPRNIGDEFRWNVPILSYGIDQSFVDFFGPEGVNAVTEVFQRFNELPTAAEIDLGDFPFSVRRLHLNAQSSNVYDLRSFMAAYLLEQIGLGNSIRQTWVNTSVEAPLDADEANDQAAPFMIRRSFDPFTLAPTHTVNNVSYSYQITELPAPYPAGNRVPIVYHVNQAGLPAYPVAALPPAAGEFFPLTSLSGARFPLTRDDAAGLKYLLQTNNVNVEPIHPGAVSSGNGQLVTDAARPGVGKITFFRFPVGGPTVTVPFQDRYISNGVVYIQNVVRHVNRPDILITAENHPRDATGLPPFVRRTPPNFSHEQATGSGIFQGGVIISFQKLGDIYSERFFTHPDAASLTDPRWATFNAEQADFFTFPAGAAYLTGRTVSVRQLPRQNETAVEWTLRLIDGVRYHIDASSDLNNWSPWTNFTGTAIHTLTNTAPLDTAARFLRVRRAIE